MDINLKLFNHRKKIILTTTVLYLLAVTLLVFIALVGLNFGVPLENFTKDPTAVAEINPFTGVISNLGILCWCTTASVCLFCFSSLSNRRSKRMNDYTFFLLFFGLISLTLMLDDLFLFHEVIAPKILRIPEELTLLAYGVTILFGIFRFKKIILRTEWAILGMAFTFLAMSVTIDFYEEFITAVNSIFLEDSCKFLGIISWVNYFVLASLQIDKKVSQVAKAS